MDPLRFHEDNGETSRKQPSDFGLTSAFFCKLQIYICAHKGKEK